MNKQLLSNKNSGLFPGVTWIVWIQVLLWTGCSGCEPDDDEKLIRVLVSHAVERAEQHNVADLFDLATKTFVANPGSHDRRSSKAMLMILFRRYRSFRIVHPTYSVELSDDRKAANVAIPFLIVREGQTIPDFSEFFEQPSRWLEEAGKAADPFMLNARLVKTDGEWLVAIARITGRQSVGF